jgi:hypothetical protein
MGVRDECPDSGSVRSLGPRAPRSVRHLATPISPYDVQYYSIICAPISGAGDSSAMGGAKYSHGMA